MYLHTEGQRRGLEGRGRLIAVHYVHRPAVLICLFKQCNKLLIPSLSVHMNERKARNNLNITFDCCGNCLTQNKTQLICRTKLSSVGDDVSDSVQELFFIVITGLFPLTRFPAKLIK